MINLGDSKKALVDYTGSLSCFFRCSLSLWSLFLTVEFIVQILESCYFTSHVCWVFLGRYAVHPSVGSLCLQGVPQHLAGPRSRLEDSSLQTHGLPGQRVSQHQPRLENDTRGLGLGQVSNHCLDWRIAFPFSLIVTTCCVLTSGREWCCVKVWVQKIDWK